MLKLDESYLSETIEIRYSHRCGVYISSYNLSKVLGKKHQNLMTSIRNKNKNYIHYYRIDNPYYKNQKIYCLTIPMLERANKKETYSSLLLKMKEFRDKKEKEMKIATEKFFSKFMSI
ncbi:MAG: hypothetical protein ACK5NU_16285 [Fusobacterium ulcerans]|uniref:hypothetical protein n=1 Tax=Fusobacterium ulcerans TaxID=861 RepID=UPI003A87E0C2